MVNEALKLWIGLPADTRQMLLNNVWCGECRKAVTIVDYQAELREWRAKLKPRKQKLEDDFAAQLEEQEKFYGGYLAQAIPPLSPHELTPETSSQRSRRLSSQRSTSSSISSVSADGS